MCGCGMRFSDRVFVGLDKALPGSLDWSEVIVVRLKDDGTYDYDLSIVDKYLDTALKHMGTPKFVSEK